MNRTNQKALCELVKIGVTDECLFSEVLYNVDWDKLYELICQQGVMCLCMRAMEVLHSHEVEICPTEMKLQLYAMRQQVERQYKKNYAIAQEFANGLIPLKCVVLKGIDYALYWDYPTWREFGDLDSWAYGSKQTHEESFKKSNECAVKFGAHITEAGYRHNQIAFNGLTIENHLYLTGFGGRGENGRQLEICLQKLLANGDELVQIGDTNLYSPSAEFTALYMIVHAQRHFILEGITLRHILDWFFFLKKEGDKLDWAKTNDALRRFRLERFAGVMTAFCMKHFGLKAVSGLNYDVSDELLVAFEDDIFSERYSVGNRNPWYICKRIVNRFKRMWVFRELNTVSYLKAVWLTLTFNSALNRKPRLSNYER